MSSSGLKLAARYSLPPCNLGFCGPLDKKNRQTLYGFAFGKDISEEKVRGILERFEALYPYLKLIASANGIDSPLDEQVIKAYWIGNKFLDNVSTGELRTMIKTEFAGAGRLSKEEAEERAAQIPDGALPHHSFHVLILGSITGRVKLDDRLKELCRVSWGRVVSMGQEAGGRRQGLEVRCKPLVFGKRVQLGKEVEREVELDGRLVPKVETGDWVSLHWGQVCDVLSAKDVTNLGNYTQRTISLISGKRRRGA